MLIASALLAPTGAQAADHFDAPNVTGLGSVDITDLFAFQSLANTDRTALVLAVNPFSGGVSPAGTGSGLNFATNAAYEFQIDTDGDALFDLTYTTTFGAVVDGQQSVTTVRTDALGNSTTIAQGSTEQNITLTESTGQLRAGRFDDPFFFDDAGLDNGLQFTGTDFFAGADVSAIVLEIDSSDFGAQNIAIQGRTLLNGEQVDRIGRPAINTVLVPGDRQSEFNLADPVNDLADFGDDTNAIIASLSNQENADALTPILLADLLTFEVGNPEGFLNGRRLEDDVIDAELALLSAGALTTDGVDANDRIFSAAFPFLASANSPVPEPTTAALLGLAGLSVMGRRRRA